MSLNTRVRADLCAATVPHVSTTDGREELRRCVVNLSTQYQAQIHAQKTARNRAAVLERLIRKVCVEMGRAA